MVRISSPPLSGTEPGCARATSPTLTGSLDPLRPTALLPRPLSFGKTTAGLILVRFRFRFLLPPSSVPPVRCRSVQTPRGPVFMSLRFGGGRDDNKPSDDEQCRAAPKSRYPLRSTTSSLHFHNKSVCPQTKYDSKAELDLEVNI